MNKKNITIYQYSINPINPAQNFQKIRYAIAEAAEKQSSLIIFPELCLHGYNYEIINSSSEMVFPNVTKDLRDLAKTNHIALAGTFAEVESGKFYNTFIFIDPYGEVIHKYRKIHLFNLMGENNYFSPGEFISPFNSIIGESGAAICYDLRFPEVFRKMTAGGAKVIILPAEWPKLRIDHWNILLRARAIENQVFMIGVNCVGSTLGIEFGGYSAVINPWGETVAQLKESEGSLTVSIDMDVVEMIRNKLPVWKDRKPAVY
jgi:predicted amidohydrolase